MKTTYKKLVHPDELNHFIREHANVPMKISFDSTTHHWLVEYTLEQGYYTHTMEILKDIKDEQEYTDNKDALNTAIHAIAQLLDMGVIKDD